MKRAHQFATPSDLRRPADLDEYATRRCASLRRHREIEREHALRDRAVTLGLRLHRLIDLGLDARSVGRDATDRAGFQQLVAEVGLGYAGIVLGLEVSRLARSSTDWHRLLELCALSNTLILDEDGLYDPSQFNDRLLLGLKGTMSEAELHVLRARLIGGVLNKARRGELKIPAYRSACVCPLDPAWCSTPTSRCSTRCGCCSRPSRGTGAASATARYPREQGRALLDGDVATEGRTRACRAVADRCHRAVPPRPCITPCTPAPTSTVPPAAGRDLTAARAPASAHPRAAPVDEDADLDNTSAALDQRFEDVSEKTKALDG